MRKLEASVFIWLVLTCMGKSLGRVVDLSHVYDERSIYYPGVNNRPYRFEQLFQGPLGQAPWVEGNFFGMSEHTGTHMDAPSHFGKGKWPLEAIPTEVYEGPGVVINITAQSMKDPDYRASLSDLQTWERNYGRIPDGAIVLLNSGWDKKYPDKKLVFGSETPEDTSTHHHPGFHEDAIQWLIDNRKLRMIGADTPSFDRGFSTTFPVHQITAAHNIPGLENVANLNQIPPSGTTIYVGTIKLRGGSGAPARVFAVVGGHSTNGVQQTAASILVFALVYACIHHLI